MLLNTDLTSPDESSFLIVWTHYFIDAMFWVVDETARWWEIGRLSVRLRTLRKSRTETVLKIENPTDESDTDDLKKKLSIIAADLEQLSGREEFLRARCWRFTPGIVFLFIFIAFLYGLVYMAPSPAVLPPHRISAELFSGELSRVRDMPFMGHNVVRAASWYNGKLYVGGDGGLSFVEPVKAIASKSNMLPADFFVRDMTVFDNNLYITGFSGIYILSDDEIKKVYDLADLPAKLFNSIEVAGANSLLIGTIGDGYLRGDEETISFVEQTAGKTIKDFGRLGNELWILHEDGVLIQRSNSFRNLDLQLLSGRHLRCMAITQRNVFIGTDQGVVAGFRNGRNWVWTLLSAGEPGFVNDLFAAGENLFIASDEGVFRFAHGRLERISSVPASTLAAGSSFLAAVNPDSVMMYYFTGKADAGAIPILGAPEVGTFTRDIPVSIFGESEVTVSRLPDFKQISQPDKYKLKIVPVPEFQEKELPEKSTVKSDFISLPSELQKPVFTSAVRADNYYLLATANRGVWSFYQNVWNIVDSVPMDGVGNLFYNDNYSFAYGSAGVYQLDKNSGFQILEGKQGLKSLYANKENLLYLLFENGKIKIYNDDMSLLEELMVPDEFAKSIYSVWEISGRPAVVLDRGVLFYDKTGQWNLFYFKGRRGRAEIVDVCKGITDNIFIALTDGRIFEFSKQELVLAGTINSRPVALNFDRVLWAAAVDSLFFMENRKFVSAPIQPVEKILGAFTVLESEAVYVFTTTGLVVITGRKSF